VHDHTEEVRQDILDEGKKLSTILTSVDAAKHIKKAEAWMKKKLDEHEKELVKYHI